ncbi:transposable element Tcb2 transposase [Trichonephila clavipes]|nr:transposable element Tcb2 transposase [Trichonephila clavipes]
MYTYSQLLHWPTYIQSQVAPSLGVPVSSRTIRRRLAEEHLGSRRPLRVLPLTLTHRRLRLEWCRALRNWTAVEWNQVVFSATNKDSISAVMTIVFVCGNSVVNASTLPLLYSDTLLPQLPYVYNILQPHVLPLMQRFPGAIFQQDNASSSIARMSQYCLRTLTTLPWPARSPDLPPIEHIWIIWDGELGILRV